MKISGGTVTLDPSLEWSPHETIGTKKIDGGSSAVDEQNLYIGEPQSISQVSLDMMSHEGYYPQASTDSVNGNAHFQHQAYITNDGQQRVAPPPSHQYYGSYPPQMHQYNQGGAYYHYGTPPMMMPPSPHTHGQYYSAPSGGGPPLPLVSYTDSSVVSHLEQPPGRIRLSSSYSSSSDTLYGPLSSNNNSRRGQRGGNNNRRRQGGSPPNRGWYRFDSTTTLYQMKGRIIEIAKDRDGSKFIQRRLQVADTDEMQIVYNEALVGIEKLWDDVYGNYILQGLMELGSPTMRDGIGHRLIDGDNVVKLSMKVYGCRLIQKALDTLDKEDAANIVSSIKGKVYLLVHDHNGNHVIQRSIAKINEYVALSDLEDHEVDEPTLNNLITALDIIIDEVTTNMKELAKHPYGCRVVQRLIEHSVGEQKVRVLDCVFEGDMTNELITHEYGNYVIQRALTYGRPEDKEAIFEIITKNQSVLKLSKQKHSSNVIEMMLTYGGTDQRHQIVEEILNCVCVDQTYESKNAVLSMAEDQFANYVLRTAIDVLGSCPLRERLFSMLVSNLDDLERSPYAKQIVLRVKTYMQESSY